MQWQFTTILDRVDHWQTLIAGLIALAAAIITVKVTLNIEQRKVDRDIDALRKSLAVELRQLIPRPSPRTARFRGLPRRTARSRRGWSRPWPRCARR